LTRRVQYDKDATIVHAGEDVSSKINHCLGNIVYLTAGMPVLDMIGHIITPLNPGNRYTTYHSSFKAILGSFMDVLGTGGRVIPAVWYRLCLLYAYLRPKSPSHAYTDPSVSPQG
jgi:hypothetical protein